MGKAVIAIHGGAGAISRAQMSLQQELRYIEALSAIVETGQKMLEAGESALDVVTEAVRLLEECPLFNAGIGAVFTRDETHELDACVMDGNTLKAGAVAGVSHLRNPVLAARLVMEQSPHVMMIGVVEGLLPFKVDEAESDPVGLAQRIEEERRLKYVGITRAQRTLAISSTKRRKKGREIVAAQPSRFIAEMQLHTASVKEDPREKLRALRAEFAKRAAETKARDNPL